MQGQQQEYISVIGHSLLEPIIGLLEELESREPMVPNEVQTGPIENGYSCALAVLAVLLLESVLNRTRFIRNEEVDRRVPAADFFATISPEQELSEHVEEIFAIRDAIVHNHLWIADVGWDEDGLIFKSDPMILEGYGNQRFRRVINAQTRSSRKLSLNLFPARIWRRDAYLTVRIASEALLTLEELDPDYFRISQYHYQYRGQFIPFSEVVASLAIPDFA